MGATGGLSYRFAFTQGERDETTTTVNSTSVKVDPVIYSTGIAYSEGPIWAAVTYQKHEDWVAAGLGDTKKADAVGTASNPSLLLF